MVKLSIAFSTVTLGLLIKKLIFLGNKECPPFIDISVFNFSLNTEKTVLVFHKYALHFIQLLSKSKL